jgi:O-antigen ligase
MHNSYLHAGIQAGVVGALLFTAAMAVLWLFVFKSGIIRRIRTADAPDRTLLTQAVLVLGFLSARSVFESTAAFYGVDLLLFVPAVAFIYQWTFDKPLPEP